MANPALRGSPRAELKEVDEQRLDRSTDR